MRARKSRYQYTGCFIRPEDWQELLKRCPEEQLGRPIENPHITFSYKPEKAHAELFGTRISFKVIGYGKDTKNQGFLVELSPGNPTINEMIGSIAVPHITISVSTDGAPVNTAHLDFKPLAEPFESEGVYGGFIALENRVDWGSR